MTLTEDQLDATARIMAAVGVTWKRGDPVHQLPLEDWMRFHMHWMFTELQEDGTASTQAILVKGDEATVVNLHFCEPKYVPVALYGTINEVGATRAVLMSEVWTAPDSRTMAEIEAGVKPARQPKDREDRSEAIVAWGWEWGREHTVAYSWAIDRDADGKPVMKELPRKANTLKNPLTPIAMLMYVKAQEAKQNAT